MPNETAAPAKVATLSQLRNTAAPEQHMPAVRMGWSDLQGFELMQRAAKALAASTLVPQQYQNNLPNALIALEMAQRIGASPLMVMQNLYIVHGRPGWSSKFLIASFNQCGRFSAVRFKWTGTKGKEDWGCQAWATEKSTGEKIEGPTIDIALAKKEGWYEKSGSKWKTIPELMLMYRAAGWMINTHAPEISMGLNTVEELGDVYDAAPAPNGTYSVTTDDLRQTGADLDQQQEAALRAVEGAGTGDGGEGFTLTYERLAAMIASADSEEILTEALDMSRSLTDDEQVKVGTAVAAARKRLAKQ